GLCPRAAARGHVRHVRYRLPQVRDDEARCHAEPARAGAPPHPGPGRAREEHRAGADHGRTLRALLLPEPAQRVSARPSAPAAHLTESESAREAAAGHEGRLPGAPEPRYGAAIRRGGWSSYWRRGGLDTAFGSR